MSLGTERPEGILARVPLAPVDGVGDPAALWEDLLTLVVDPDSTRVPDRVRKRRMLSFLLDRAGLDETYFWTLARGQRGRQFLSRWSRVSREIPQLEITSFDLDKLLKERFRQEPLTLGAAWHYGFWRSYFSHAAITHPANDGLREEFSTAWDIVRKHPAVLFRSAGGQESLPIEPLRLDLPMIVGPLPWGEDAILERAYLGAIASAGEGEEHPTRSLLVIEAVRFRSPSGWSTSCCGSGPTRCLGWTQRTSALRLCARPSPARGSSRSNGTTMPAKRSAGCSS
jgi:hypothetical protein